MRRSPLTLEAVADWHNLAAAFHRAARGKRQQPEVQRYAERLETELKRLRSGILDGDLALGRTRRFRIRDPKPRLIHAPCFRERVLHHALMSQVGPVLDRTLVDDTYACRPGKGTLAAVQRATEHARRWSWWAKIDMRAYFASIDHAILKAQLTRRFKSPGLLDLMGRIIDAHHDAPGRGLPIGALSSQQFANFYLGGLDRHLLENCRVCGLVRYMDDLVWWGESRKAVRQAVEAACDFAADALALQVKRPLQLGRSSNGLDLCGFRILPGRLLLSRRRKRRYIEHRRHWEEAWIEGRIDDRALQAGYASALALTLPADAAGWRREQLRRAPLAVLLAGL